MSAAELSPESESLYVVRMTFGDGVLMNPRDAVQKAAKEIANRGILALGGLEKG